MTKRLAIGLSALAFEVLAWASDPAPIPPSPPAWAPATAATVLPTTAPSPLLPATNDGPKIQFDAMVFDFGKAMSGEMVKHQFYFTNVGFQDLVLSNVQPQCGCTAAGDWTRQVKPGGFGVIPIQFNTANYNTPVTKIITVTSNDKTQPLLPLQLKGTVWKPIDVNPQVLVLQLRSEAPYSSGAVHITNGLEELITLGLPESNNPVFGAELKTNVPGRDFLLVVSNKTILPPGGIQGQITLKTSVTNLPVISVLVYASMQAAITISPPQIMLPPAPIPTNQLVRYITLINNTTNALTLSDASINAKDVQIAIQTLQAGKYYTVTLTFPPDFEVVPGQPAVFSVRTSNPQFEVIKVPVYQTPRLASQPVAPAPKPVGPAPGALILRRPDPATAAKPAPPAQPLVIQSSPPKPPLPPNPVPDAQANTGPTPPLPRTQ